MSDELIHIKEKLTEAGLKATHQRLVILEALMRMHFHPTADQIFEEIHLANPSISMGTVYKTLETFVKSGLLGRVYTSEGHMRYDSKLENHGHIYCSNTREIIDFYDDELNDLIVQFFRKKRVSNLRIRNISLNINGDKIDPAKDISIK